MIYWFTGQPGSGKTTLAKALIETHLPNAMHIDGDCLRELTNNVGYASQGRIENMKNAILLASFLDSKKFDVIVSMVSPYKQIRDEFKFERNVIEIYTHTTETRGKENYFASNYQKPKKDYIDIDTTNCTIQSCIDKIKNYEKSI